MLQTIAAVNQAVNNFIWGVPAMVCIIGVGLLLSVRTGFIQIRKFPYAIKTTIGRMFRKRDASDGAMTPFQAVCTALAATVGTGNIAGAVPGISGQPKPGGRCQHGEGEQQFLFVFAHITPRQIPVPIAGRHTRLLPRGIGSGRRPGRGQGR